MSLAEPLAPVCAAGEESFQDFYRRLQPQLLRYVASRYGRADAEEITAETMLRALTHYDSLDRRRSPWPWLTVVARNVGNDLWRARQQCRAVDQDDLSTVPEQRPGPHDLAFAAEDARLVQQAMETLSTSQRRCLRLRFVEGLSHRDIAEVLQRSELAVRQQVSRARAKLANEYFTLEGRATALAPVAGILAAFRWLRRQLTRHGASVLPAAMPLTMATSLALAVGGISLLVGPMVHQPQAVTASSTSSTAVAGHGRVLHSVAGSALDKRAGTKPVRHAAPAVDVSENVGQVRTHVSVPTKPFAPHSRTSHYVAVVAPVGTVFVKGELQNSSEARAVCTLPGVDCR